MKFRYRKAVFFIIIITMGIGIVSLSLTTDPKVKESLSNPTGKNQLESDITGGDISIIPSEKVMSITPGISPSPTPLPVYDLKEDAYPDITKLFKDYYKAKLNCDVDKFKDILSNPSDIPTKEQLQSDVQFVEEYNNIKCYVKLGYLTGTYVAFVYNEIKYYNIDTPAPGVDQFFVITTEDGLRIFSGDFEETDQVTGDYYFERIHDEDVQELFEETNEKGEKAKAKDKVLKDFWDKLDQNKSTPNESEGSFR